MSLEYKFQCEDCTLIMREDGENLQDAEFNLKIKWDWEVDRRGEFPEYYCKDCKGVDGYTYTEVRNIADWTLLRGYDSASEEE